MQLYPTLLKVVNVGRVLLVTKSPNKYHKKTVVNSEEDNYDDQGT